MERLIFRERNSSNKQTKKYYFCRLTHLIPKMPNNNVCYWSFRIRRHKNPIKLKQKKIQQLYEPVFIHLQMFGESSAFFLLLYFQRSC